MWVTRHVFQNVPGPDTTLHGSNRDSPLQRRTRTSRACEALRLREAQRPGHVFGPVPPPFFFTAPSTIPNTHKPNSRGGTGVSLRCCDFAEGCFENIHCWPLLRGVLSGSWPAPWTEPPGCPPGRCSEGSV